MSKNNMSALQTRSDLKATSYERRIIGRVNHNGPSGGKQGSEGGANLHELVLGPKAEARQIDV